MKTLRNIFIVLGVVVLIFVLWRSPGPKVEVQYLPADTVYVVDTILPPVPEPERVFVVRVDTVFLPVPGDTVEIPVGVPIERKEYRTPDYLVVIEGYKPALVRMELYPRTTIVTRPEIRYKKVRPKWSVGVQVGYGISRDRLAPYFGVGIQYNLLTF